MVGATYRTALEFIHLQRSADKVFFDLLCVGGLASITCISDEDRLIHAVRIICDWLPEQSAPFELSSSCFFKSIQPGSSAARIFASVIRSQIKSKPVLPEWTLRAMSCFLCESFLSYESSSSSEQFHHSVRSHIALNLDGWGLCLPPSDARAVCNGKSAGISTPAGCRQDCNRDHSGEGNCLLCGSDWGTHAGHNCPNGQRGTWIIPGAANLDSLPTECACTCRMRRSSETGLDVLVFNLGQEPNSGERPKATEKSNAMCPVCLDKGSAVFACPESFGIFPGCTVSLKETLSHASVQTTVLRVLQPGQTGFVICTFNSLALVQGPVISGIISSQMLQPVSCVVSSLFVEAPIARSLSESVFFADVMGSVAKLGASYFSPTQKAGLSASAVSLTEALFSSFGPEYSGPCQLPFHMQSDFVFLCRSTPLFVDSLKHVLESIFSSVDDLAKLLGFLNALGSENWEEVVPHVSYLAYSSGISEITRQIQEHFFNLLFSRDTDSGALGGAALYKLVSSLSPKEVSYLAHILRHSVLPCNFFLPFLSHVAIGIATGSSVGDRNRLILSFLQQCIPPGAFLQLRHALLQLSVSVPVPSRFLVGSKGIQVTRVQRWVIDLLVPPLGASCAAIVDGAIESILPYCGWCNIVLPGQAAFRLAIPEGLVLDVIYLAGTPVSLSDLVAHLPLQEFFVVEALRTLVSKQLIVQTGSAANEFVLSSQMPRLHPATSVALCPSFHCMGDEYCTVVHAIFSRLKSTPCMYEHELLRVLCRDKAEVKGSFSGSFVAFVLSRMLATGKIVRDGPLLLLAGGSMHSDHSSFEPRKIEISIASCIRSMVVVACDESASMPPLSPSAAGACESFAYDRAMTLVGDSFTRISQETGIDLVEVSESFELCKGNLVETIHTLMFNPKFSLKLKDGDSSPGSGGAGRIRFVEEGFCPICCDEKTLVALPCGHRYCQFDLQEYIRDSMANSSTPKAAGGADRAGGRLVTNICCPAHTEGCSYMISTADVKFVATGDFSSFVGLICRQSTRSMASGAFPTVTCACGRLIVGQSSESEYECACGLVACIGDVKNSVESQNWVAHPFSSCLQEERWKEFTQVGSEARLLLMRTKKCPSCGTKTTKCGCSSGAVVCNSMDRCPNEACDHMDCQVCHTHWCWVCGRHPSHEARCTYPQHLITQAKELFKDAEVKVQLMEKEFFKHSWRVIRFDTSQNTATVLSVDEAVKSPFSLAKGDRIIAINGQTVISVKDAQKMLSRGWAPGHSLRIEFQRSGVSKLLVCQAPPDPLSQQDAFVMRRSRIVQSVSEIAGSPDYGSSLEKSRALLDKVITGILTSEPGQSEFSFAPATLKPLNRDGPDVITNAVMDHHVKNFLRVAGFTSDAHIPQIVADLADKHKSLLKSASSSGHTSHSERFFPDQRPAASAATDSLFKPSQVDCYVWKSWAFAATSSPSGHLRRTAFWCHNGTIKPVKEQPARPNLFMLHDASGTAVPAALGGAVASSASPKAEAAVTRAIERCDKFGGSVAILDGDQEAWLFDCSQSLSPIDPSTATRGRSIQSRPWELKNLKPTFCESIVDFCSKVLGSTASKETESKASKNVSVMHSVELDAVLHRCGSLCLVIHGNGDWATCHASHIPSSFTESTLAPPGPVFSFSNLSGVSSPAHIGSWDGCGGNFLGVSACAGDGNCSPQCVNCGARSHWTCCGSNDKDSKTCSGAINTLQATENDRLFRLVVRPQPVACRTIQGLSGGQFSFLLLTSAATSGAPAAGLGATS